MEIKYICSCCNGYLYDPEKEGRIEFDDLPEEWKCPLCGDEKDHFYESIA